MEVCAFLFIFFISNFRYALFFVDSDGWIKQKLLTTLLDTIIVSHHAEL
jgi:hypothetical protein